MNKWCVDVKGKWNGHYEISVIKFDNKHGIRSWGWLNNHDKLLIASNSCAGTLWTTVSLIIGTM